MTVVRARLDLLRQLLCKTVVHLSSPPLLALSMGLLLLLSSGTTDKVRVPVAHIPRIRPRCTTPLTPGAQPTRMHGREQIGNVYTLQPAVHSQHTRRYKHC